MKIIEEKTLNNDIEIHYITNLSENNSTSLLIIPGLAEAAEDYVEVMKQTNRKSIAISLRGRGKSDAPLTGYTLEDHIQDIERVVEQANLDEFILLGYSRGVSYMLGYALKYPEKVKGIIIGDYPAIHSKLPEEWADWFAKLPPWRGKEILERMKRHTLEGIQKESKEKEFWKELSSLECPVLVIRGGKKGALLTKELSELYKESLQNVEVIAFEDCSHDLFEPNIDNFINTVLLFIEKII